MKTSMRAAILTATLAGGVLLGVAVAQGQKQVMQMSPDKATYKELAPGASAAVLWGDMDKGPYGAYTKFVPGADFALHTHTNDIRIVVVRGAYLYKPEKGEAKRVAAGEFFFIPGGDRHASGADAKEGVIFYQESSGKFDLNFIK